MHFGVQRDMSRIQKALEALDQLTPQQIEQLSTQESLAELRAKRLSNLKSKLGRDQGEGEVAAEKEGLTDGQQGRVGVKWDLFKEMPIISYKQEGRNYEKEFNSTIDAFRLQVRKEEERKSVEKKVVQPEIAVEKEKPQKKENQKNAGIFNVVFSNQTGPLGANPFGMLANINQKPLIPPPSIEEKTGLFQGPKPIESLKNDPKIMPIKPIEVPQNPTISFVPGLVPRPNPSLFTKKFDVPESAPPQPIKPKAGLFSQSNPLASLQSPSVPIFNPNNAPAEPKKVPGLFSQQEKPAPKPNIFAKTLTVEQSEPVKPVVDPKGSLFSNNNPWASESDNKEKKNIFFNNNATPQEPEQAQVESKPIEKQEKPVKKQPQVEKPKQHSIFSSTAATPNIFSNSTSSNTTPNIFSSNPKSLGFDPSIVKNSQNEGLFKNATVTVPSVPLFTPPPILNVEKKMPEVKKDIPYESGSLFTNTFKPAETVPKAAEPKPQVKPQPKPESKNPFEFSKPSPQPQAQPKPNIFTTPLPTTFPTKSQSSKPLPADIFAHHKPQPSPSVSPFGNLPKPSFFNLKPVEQSKEEIEKAKKEKQINQEVQRLAAKTPNQLFGDFIKSKPDNMFAMTKKENDGLFSSGVKPGGTSIFGNLSSGGFGSGTATGIFNSLPQTNIFGSGSTAKTLFGAPSTIPQPAAQKAQDDEQAEQQQGEQPEVIEQKDEADPTLSTGNYKYEQSVVKYRETVLKFKKGTENIIQNVTLTLQKFAGNENHTLCVRFINKCHYFTGTIVPGVTEIAKIKENQCKNLCVKKVVTVDKDGKPGLELLKIQFKDQAQGLAFYQKFNQVNKKNNK